MPPTSRSTSAISPRTPTSRALSFNCNQGEMSVPQTMSKASIPVFETVLNALSAVLDKAEAHAGAKKFEPSVLLSMRLAPDMFALTRQVQVATDQAKNGTAR